MTLKSITSQTMEWLRKIEPSPKKIIVFDIDDTLIDNYGVRINPVYEIYRYAVSQGFTIAIITNRPGGDLNIKITQDQLFINEIRKYRFLYFRNPKRTDPYRYKSVARKNLHDRGYETILSIGDMPWDIGDYGGLGVIVPPSPFGGHI
jgi:predicted secreted acid phosphatase